MSKPTIQIHNIETDEVIIREMTASEIEAYEEDLEKQKISDEYAKAQAEAKAVARQAILDRLGLTEEEARLLLG